MARRRPPLGGRVTSPDDTPANDTLAADRQPGTHMGSSPWPTIRGSRYGLMADAYFNTVAGAEPLFGYDYDDGTAITRRGSAHIVEVVTPPAVFTSPARTGAGAGVDDETELPLDISLVSLEEAARRQQKKHRLETLACLERQERRRHLQEAAVGLKSGVTSGNFQPSRTYQPGRQLTVDPIVMGPSASTARLAAPWRKREEEVEMQNLGGLFQHAGPPQPPTLPLVAFGSPSDQTFLA